MPVHALPAPVRVHMLSPLTFNDAQEIGDRVKSGASVFLVNWRSGFAILSAASPWHSMALSQMSPTASSSWRRPA
jgi:hypothetical protein